MLAKRLAVVAVLLPIGLLAIYYGSWAYLAVILLLYGIAAWEYGRMLRLSGYQPFDALIIGGVLMFMIQRTLDQFTNAPLLLSLLVLASMTYHLAAYERGRNQAAADFGVTMAGFLYLGWIGAYVISLRDLPEGRWWTLMTLISVWVADGAAYLVGVRWGRHSLSPRLSPKKTWEGYLASILGGMLCGAVLGYVFPLLGAKIPPASGVWLGLAMGAAPTLGDLGESMIKRQAGVKDSGQLLPGHGGMFDRIDSWLWAGVIAYYLIIWLWI